MGEKEAKSGMSMSSFPNHNLPLFDGRGGANETIYLIGYASRACSQVIRTRKGTYG
jgi:hypothetical protein